MITAGVLTILALLAYAAMPFFLNAQAMMGMLFFAATVFSLVALLVIRKATKGRKKKGLEKAIFICSLVILSFTAVIVGLTIYAAANLFG